MYDISRLDDFYTYMAIRIFHYVDSWDTVIESPIADSSVQHKNHISLVQSHVTASRAHVWFSLSKRSLLLLELLASFGWHIKVR